MASNLQGCQYAVRGRGFFLHAGNSMILPFLKVSRNDCFQNLLKQNMGKELSKSLQRTRIKIKIEGKRKHSQTKDLRWSATEPLSTVT